MENKEPAADRFGRLAFAYCKIATVSLLLGRFALPVAALLSATFFILGWVRGKKETKCYLRYPLLAAGFWLAVLAIWFAIEFAPTAIPSWLKWIHR
ncbi:MAG: hypothetical protein ABL949_03190 [Fimbriimonadaceae bacterium]